MPIDPCLPVPLNGYTPSAPPVHRIHRIIGRIRRHGTARHVGVHHGMAPLDGCGRVPAGLPGALPGHGDGGAPAAFLPKIIPAAAGGAALVGGSGVVGGFGGGGIPGVPSGPVTPGSPTTPCVGTSCSTGPGPTPVPEPSSILLFGLAMLVMLMLRRQHPTSRHSTL